MKTIPEGFDLELTAPPRQDNESSYVYIAAYRTPDNADYFVIQAGGTPVLLPEDTEEVFTTTAGLVLQFMPESATPDEKHYQYAVVKAPDGADFMISSTLPRGRVKALAEELSVVH